MSTAVITIVAGRHEHLRRQQQGLATGDAIPDVCVVVGMGDAGALDLTRQGPLSRTSAAVLTVALPVTLGPGGARDLPLAAARNAGAEAAVAAGADTLIFLDVDCIPSPGLVGGYRSAVAAAQSSSAPGAGPYLHCGVVRYLDEATDLATIPLPPDAGRPHPARPLPAAGTTLVDREWPLFWSLSFAVSAADWLPLGGFDQAYAGYGGEDTDLGYRAFRAGFSMSWPAGADAHHQYHPTQRPPVAHLHDIVRNATRFHRAWGFWIMTGWLEAFRDLGLVDYDAAADAWSVIDEGAAACR